MVQDVFQKNKCRICAFECLYVRGLLFRPKSFNTFRIPSKGEGQSFKDCFAKSARNDTNAKVLKWPQAVGCVIALGIIFSVHTASAGGQRTPKKDSDQRKAAVSDEKRSPEYQDVIAFFNEVYDTMDKNYYFALDRKVFDRFIERFDQKIYPEIKKEGKTTQYVKWRSAAYLVEDLRSSEDIFSAFFPPKAAKKYEGEALGKKVDLGITGRRINRGYQVTQVEPRSDAYAKGLRPRDILVKIDQAPVVALSEEKIQDLLTPLENTVVHLDYFVFRNRQEAAMDVTSREYFKQTVFMIPVKVPGVFCLQIPKFNQATADDLTKYMGYILKQGNSDLVIDLRDNPGGPPLAAREISAFFLPPKDEFAYFQKKNQPKSMLYVPEIPDRFRYKGDVVILVDQKSGSASELFAGILQGKKRAKIMGTNTAGQVLLKSMFYFKDDSMVLLVTARGHHPDGGVFSFKGITPDEPTAESGSPLIEDAANFLVREKKQ